MSGTPKYSTYHLEQENRRRLEAERLRNAQLEQQRRQEAEERVRQKRVEQKRTLLNQEVKALGTQISASSPVLLAEDQATLNAAATRISAAIEKLGTDAQAEGLQKQIRQLNQDFQASQDRFMAAEAARLDRMERATAEKSRVNRALQSLPGEHRRKFDPVGDQTVTQVLERLNQMTAENEAVFSLLEESDAAVRTHLQTVAKEREDWLRRQNLALNALNQSRQNLEGLQSDPVLMRWHHPRVQDMQAKLSTLESFMPEERFEDVVKEVFGLAAKSQELIAQAQTLQLKADQRDYVIDSVSEALKKIGFDIDAVKEDDPGHPMTSRTIKASSNAGKMIDVSVPAEGEVWYTVDGFRQQTSSSMGQSQNTCDQAEATLNEMQKIVQDLFGVKMGEIIWKGKPTGELTTVEELKSGESTEKTK